MKITVLFDNGSTLVLAPEQLTLAQVNATQLSLAGRAGDYSIPIASFPGSLAPEGVNATELVAAVTALYSAGHWTSDRIETTMEENALWDAVKRAAGIPHGTAPKPLVVAAPKPHCPTTTKHYDF